MMANHIYIRNFVSPLNIFGTNQKDCFIYFQDYLEKWIIEILQYSNNITLYSKKTRVSADDIEMASSIMERRQPSFLDSNIEEDQHFIKFEEKDDN